MFAARPGPPGVLPVGPPQISSIFPGGRTLLCKREGRFPAVSRGSAPPQGGGAPPMPPHPSLVASWGLVSGQAAGLGHSEQKGPWGQRLGQWPMGRRGPGLPPQDWAQSPPPLKAGAGVCSQMAAAQAQPGGAASRASLQPPRGRPPQPPAGGTRSRTALARSGRGQEAEELSCLPERRELPPAPRRGQSRLRWGRSLVVGSV